MGDLLLLEYGHATMESRGGMIPVELKLSDQGVVFKNVKTGKQETLSPEELEVVNWQRLAGGFGVRIFSAKGNLHRFGGFKESDKGILEKFFKNTLKKTMTDREYSLKGWNYGAANFNGESLSFDISHHPAFEVPLSNVSQCITGKNEVTLEFHQHDDVPVSLVELRFHLPPTDAVEGDHVEVFKERVMRKAQVITATGDAMIIFSQMQCLTPRGRYDIKMYPSFIQLHGKTYDFKIPISTVLRLFLLPHSDGRQHFFVVYMDPPIKSGQTRYPYLILLFADEDEDEIELTLSEEELKEKFDGRLEKEMSGPQFELVGRIFKGICGKKIVTPGSFIGHTGSPAVGCSYKAAAGYIYPLERGFFYVHKPPMHVRFDEIASINFARSGSTGRSFDFEIQMRDNTLVTFSNIEKGEYTKLYDYVTNKKLRIKNKGGHVFSTKKGDDGEPDHYMNRVRAEANERDSGDEDDDDSESEDSDFRPGAVSDVAEEFDSNPSTSQSEGSASEGGTPKKKKESKPKRAKRVSEKPRRARKQKKDKDVNAPKRPQSGYFLWLGEHREQIKSENPGISITDISKKAGEMWGKVSDKTEWNEKAVVAKKNYEKAMEEYRASGGGLTTGGSTNKAKKDTAKDKNISSPTKAGSGHGFKSKEYIDEDESSSASDSDDKPLNKIKKKAKESPAKKTKGETKKKPKEGSEADEEGSEDEESEKPKKEKPKKVETDAEEEEASMTEQSEAESDKPKKKKKKEQSKAESGTPKKKKKGQSKASPKKKPKKEESDNEESEEAESEMSEAGDSD